MSRTKTTTPEAPKEPKVIKVKTVVVAVAMFVALVASFVSGIVFANSYNDNVKAQAINEAADIVKQLNVK